MPISSRLSKWPCRREERASRPPPPNRRSRPIRPPGSLFPSTTPTPSRRLDLSGTYSGARPPRRFPTTSSALGQGSRPNDPVATPMRPRKVRFPRRPSPPRRSARRRPRPPVRRPMRARRRARRSHPPSLLSSHPSSHRPGPPPCGRARTGADEMIVQQFLRWVQTAPPGERADATSALARAYLHSPLDAADRKAAEAAMTVLLDDASPMVRQALAIVLAPSPHAPRPIIHALSQDQGEIASLVLAQSPLLTEAELIDAVALGDWRA